MTRIKDVNIVGIPPNLWPPALELPDGKWLSQTGAIISYLAPKFGLAGYAKDAADIDEDEKAYLKAKSLQLFLTVLDMLVEVSGACSIGAIYGSFIVLPLQVHNVHHPVSAALTYEEQQAEALRAAGKFRTVRIPSFFGHFQSVLETNPVNKDGKGNVFYFSTILEIIVNVVDAHKGPFLLSNITIAADLALFHNLTGLQHAFPRRLKNLKESGWYFSPFVAPSLTIRPNRQIQSRLRCPGAHPE
jgi:glutathione S-transferase